MILCVACVAGSQDRHQKQERVHNSILWAKTAFFFPLPFLSSPTVLPLFISQNLFPRFLIQYNRQERSQEFVTGDKRGVWDSGGRKSPAGSRGRAPVGTGAKPQKPETNANFQLRRGDMGACPPVPRGTCTHVPLPSPWLRH